MVRNYRVFVGEIRMTGISRKFETRTARDGIIGTASLHGWDKSL
jgi:hypothetical protein